MSAEQGTNATAELTWFKSSYSGSDGGNCVEVAWFKSSYSGTGGGDCEVAAAPGTVHVRDSKVKQGSTLAFAAEAWAPFIAFAAGR
ncbi:DUF397 domain-containing protein [Actinacidiphila oryziradicis]|uniref:DUF397 domain-containing protein n=1 Tax=Actinacidiphila oryziradicis TaxID=2571141 RepID=A0A4U0SCX3_9ACTN|nr:DUF397 domain-containing protein [Actinacidiphila oryziradicis]TKA06468.1 DUF397 domain-containing protein [Actinacidiphila oryziradicis]